MQRRTLLMAAWPAPMRWLTGASSAAGAALGALTGAASAAGPSAPTVRPRLLSFPADFGAHPDARTEWWYATGELRSGARVWGFQVTFFRSSTGVSPGHPSRFAANQLVFAHAALTDLAEGRLHHDQRIARAGFGIAEAAVGDTRVALRDWHLGRAPSVADRSAMAASRYTTHVASDSAGFTLDLQLDTTQPMLLQGDAGYSRKGPQAGQASLYYSQPQLEVSGSLMRRGERFVVTGRAWLDHEWSDTLMDPAAVGWDWIGMNLDDGAALTAFRLRRADGNALYAGGSFRRPGEAPRIFGPDEVRFTPGRVWQSAGSKARYPVEWMVDTPARRFQVKALLDDQELDSRGSTGAIYWEGLSALLDDGGKAVGRGYLELTGYAAALKL